MKKLFLVLVALLTIGSPVFAQPLSDAQCSIVRAIDAKFPALNKGTDDQRREFALKVAQQFTFSFPGDGWGSKSADPGRPQTKDVLARFRSGVLDGWELVDGATRSIKCNDHIALNGQHFIAVDPVDYLGGGSTPPPPPPGDFATRVEMNALIGSLQQRLDAVDAKITKLETGTGGSTPQTGDTLALLQEQLATSKQILELLKKTAGKFGVQ